MITVERDPRTREIVITGPDGFTTALEDNVIVHQQLLRLQRLLNEVYQAGFEAGTNTGYDVGRREGSNAT